MSTAQVALARHQRLSPAAMLTVAAVVGGGVFAAVNVSPVFIVTTLAMAILLLRSAAVVPTPAEGEDSEFSEFPNETRETVRAALKELESNDARRLLLAVVVQARPIFTARESLLDPAAERETRDNAAALVRACCDTAYDLANLDASSLPAGPSSPTTDVTRRKAAVRVKLTERLTSAASALGSLYVAGLENGGPASSRVAELVTEISADAKARTAAAAELTSLLGE